MPHTGKLDEHWGKLDQTHDPSILAAFQPRRSDVLITTAPKAGTTWMQQILHQLRSGGDPDFNSIDEVVPWLEVPRRHKTTEQILAGFEAIGNPRLFKTHCTFEQTPGGVDLARIILSSRDPRDCCVSFYHHLLNFTDEARQEHGLEIPDSFDDFVDEWLDAGVWYRNIKSWWPHKDHPNVLWLRYQDMKQDLPVTIQKILAFLDWQISAIERQAVLEYCSFAWMKENADRFTRPAEGDKPLFKPSSFIRNGKVGDYKSLLTDEHEQQILTRARETLELETLQFLELD